MTGPQDVHKVFVYKALHFFLHGSFVVVILSVHVAEPCMVLA